MKIQFPGWIAPAIAAFALVAAPSFSYAITDAEAAAGRALVKKYSDALVGVELVVVTKGGGRRGGSGPTERKVEVSGTVIAANGLTVVSLATIDSGAAAVGSRGGVEPPETEFKEVKLRMADNSEVTASVVLKDAELDVAFIAPTGEGPVRDFPFVNLADTADPTVLGTYFEIGRLSKALQRVAVVNTVTVIGTIERPRKLILLEDNATLGCPIFDQQGKVIGIGLVYSSNGSLVRAVIAPAADIADMAKQANTARESELPIPLPAAK